MSVSFPNRNFYTSDESMHTFRRDLRARDTEAFVQFYCTPNDCVPWFTICSLMRDHARWIKRILKRGYMYNLRQVLWDEIFFFYENIYIYLSISLHTILYRFLFIPSFIINSSSRSEIRRTIAEYICILLILLI